MQAGQEPIRILLVEDHALFRDGVGRLLGAEADFEIVGSCGSIEEGLDLLQDSAVDIVLLDYYFDGRGGTEFILSARKCGFSGRILIVTAVVDEREIPDLIRAGISGIFLKRDSPELLAQAIRRVFSGRLWFDQQQIKSAVSAQTMRTVVPPVGFTEREQLILSCVSKGFTNKKIAEQIGVSTSSVKGTLQQLFSKTGVRTRSQLVRVTLEKSDGQF